MTTLNLTVAAGALLGRCTHNLIAFLNDGDVTAYATAQTAMMKRTAFVLLGSFNVAAIEVDIVHLGFTVFRMRNFVMEFKIVRVTKMKVWGNAHSTAHLEKVLETFQDVTEKKIARTLATK